jgi:hypothetical protein
MLDMGITHKMLDIGMKQKLLRMLKGMRLL